MQTGVDGDDCALGRAYAAHENACGRRVNRRWARHAPSLRAPKKVAKKATTKDDKQERKNGQPKLPVEVSR